MASTSDCNIYKNGPDNSGSRFIIGDPRLRGDDNCGLFHESAVDGLVFLELATSSKKLEDELAYDSLTLYYISH